MSADRWGRLADRWWSLVSPVYDPAVALVGWHRALDALVADVRGGRVLDVGCGPAHLAPALSRRGVEYVGVDRSGAMVARARRRVAGRGGVIVRADVTRLPFPDGSFDVVVASAVLGLLPGPARRSALDELVRVTRGEVRLLEPVHRPGARPHDLRARIVALARGPLLELAELSDAGLEPSLGESVLGGVYSAVRAARRPGA